MKEYSEATPQTILLDGTRDIDILDSPYVNIRFGASVDTIITITAKYEANLPGLAFDYYGDQRYWRALLAFNGMVDPINDIQVGVVLGLPNKNSLETFLTKNKSSVQQPVLII
jgi:hypothetical protein